MAADKLIALWLEAAKETRSNYRILDRIGHCYAASSPFKTAALIIPLPADDPLARGRVLGSVRLQYEIRSEFDVGGKTWAQPAAVIDCLDTRLLRTFAVVVRDVADRLQAVSPTSKHVATALSAWDELLRQTSKLSDISELGLWGELHIISMAADRGAMVEVWRGPFRETIDFFGGGVALECKTSAKRHRHQVSHDQATFEGDNVSAFVASVWVAEDPTSGRTLVDKIDEIMESLPDEAVFRAKLLTAGYREDHRGEYLRRFACPSTPCFFRMEHIPRIREIDDRITNIRYDVDLSRVPKLPEAEIRALFTALIGE